MIVLKNGYIGNNNTKNFICDILNKTNGNNIMSFSKYVDEIIDINQLNNIINKFKPSCCCSSNDDYNEIIDIKNRLYRYNVYVNFFEKTFEKAKEDNIFEFSIISLVIIERKDFDKFERERTKCPNRVDKILYHGSQIDSISSILMDQFIKSEKQYQFGKGVYFTDSLDYCWYYGGTVDNRKNMDTIPNIDDTYTLVASFVYYDKNRCKQVVNSHYTPKKNEINIGYVGSHYETLPNSDKHIFVGNEFVINDLNQICPFIGAKLKRNEFCVIWRDTNFSTNPVYFNKFDQKFKAFLNKRKSYIEKKANYNIYLCENTSKALKLIKRKKYNKIILISNIGNDLNGKKFIDEARKIIRSNTIVLFLAYNKSHLDWVKDYKNALFSNELDFYEKYLDCFDDPKNINIKINSLIENLESHYNVKFNFDLNYLNFPLFKNHGYFCHLRF